jgi:DNA processing protein
MSPPDDVRDLLALHLVPGLGPVRLKGLLERIGPPGRILGAGEQTLAAVPGVGPKLAQAIASAGTPGEVEAEWERARKAGVRLVALGTLEYPEALSHISDAPHLLYVRGSILPEDARAVALVGSRRCTEYGRRMAVRLAAGLARAGVTVVSGLARGIDGVAHRAALEAGGRTLAVLAGGLGRIYPPEHTGLAGEVVKAGALLSESPMRQESLPGLFPARNRLISGLCQAVVIVEAPSRSGALITASHAGEQGRGVLAVPGPADAEGSAGCHELIRKGAVLCRGVEDVLEEIDGVSATVLREEARAKAPASRAPGPALKGPPAGLNEVQLRTWEFLGEGGRHLDEVVQGLGLSVAQVTGVLLMLEVKKVVRRLPGNRYERC